MSRPNWAGKMTDKILIIDDCWYCKHNIGGMCDELDEFTPFGGVHEDCPLPDAKLEQE